jgi:hypothetical protein
MTSMRVRSLPPSLVWFHDVIVCTRCEELAQAGHQVWFGNFMTSMRALGRCEELATRFDLVLL